MKQHMSYLHLSKLLTVLWLFVVFVALVGRLRELLSCEVLSLYERLYCISDCISCRCHLVTSNNAQINQWVVILSFHLVFNMSLSIWHECCVCVCARCFLSHLFSVACSPLNFQENLSHHLKLIKIKQRE